ncbi:Nn.00g027380.m01.CDS01 [Neocucurbitaria sp. VM-36]
MKNPNEKLDQLRRSSLIEFEHLKKDPHPDPPLRALPEHSVVTEYDAEAPHVPLSGGASPHGMGHFDGTSERKIPLSPAPPGSLGRPASAEHHSLGHLGHVPRRSSTDDQVKGEQTVIREQIGDEPVDQPPAPSLDKEQAPEARGIAGQDFAGHTGTHASSQVLSSGSSSSHSQNWSSSTSQQSSSTQQSASQQQSGSMGQQIQAGKLTFTLPDFGDGNSSDTKTGKEDILSPTQPGDDEDERKGQGLF